jgi:hypothetical protein
MFSCEHFLHESRRRAADFLAQEGTVLTAQEVAALQGRHAEKRRLAGAVAEALQRGDALLLR